MNSTIKKLSSLSLCFLSTIALVACGGGKATYDQAMADAINTSAESETKFTKAQCLAEYGNPEMTYPKKINESGKYVLLYSKSLGGSHDFTNTVMENFVAVYCNAGTVDHATYYASKGDIQAFVMWYYR